MRVLFDKIPFPLEVKVYLFNITNSNDAMNGGKITNSNDVMNGGKPHLQEIGPYIFE